MKIKLKIISFLLIWCQVLVTGQIKAQDSFASIKFESNTEQEQSIPLKEAIDLLEKTYQVSFLYESEIIDGKLVKMNTGKNDSFEKSVQKILGPLNLSVTKIGENAYHIRSEAKIRNLQKVDKKNEQKNPESTESTQMSGTFASISGRGVNLSFLNQEVVVSGQVKSNEDNQPIPGVNILVKGTTSGTTTDIDGKYNLRVPGNDAVLIFSFIGYLSEEILVGGRSVIDVNMVADIQTLGEVVVVGYGTQKKENLTGAVSAVKIDDKITSRALTNVSSGMAGLIPGLSVNQNRGMAGNNNANLLIRGLGSVNNANPLIVVDGMPDVDINRINMNDIESISVLKDAASSAVYGSRAANGVILITTKSGKGQEKTRIDYNGSYAVEEPTRAYEYMDDYARALTLHQYAAAVNTLPQNQLFRNGTVDQWMAMGMIDPLAYPNTNWWDVIMRQGSVQNHNISASGGSDRSNFFISLGVMDQQGLQINNDFNRYNARFNFDYKIRDNMNVGARFGGNWSNYTYAFEEGFTDDASTVTNGFDLQYAIAGITPYDPVTGNFGGTMAYNEDLQAFNPYTFYTNNLNKQNRQEVNPMVYWDWSPWESLTFRVDYTLNYYNQFRWSANMPNRAYNFQTRTFGTRWYVGENAGVSNLTSTGYKTQLNSRINYHKVFAKNHDVSLTLVYNEEYWYDRDQFSSRNDRLHPSLHEIDAALTDIQGTGGSSDTEGLRSYIGRLNYVAFDKYLFEANFRYDGSSKFLDGSRFGFFPSAAVGWRFTEEEFMRPLTGTWLTEGKLRASYGSLGNNSAIRRYEQQETLAASNYMIDNKISKGFVYRKMVNQSLSWEETSVFNIGMDLGFFNNRLTAEIDYYDRLTTGMIRPSEMSILLTGAYDAPRMNIGDLRNQGVEGNFTWRENMGQVDYMINFNASYNKTTLEEWSEFLDKGWVFLNMPYHYVYTYEDRGIAQTWEDVYNATPQGASPGDILREDLNGDGRIDGNDRKAYPNLQRDRPTTNFALNSSFAWKNFDVSFLFQGSAGRKDFWINNYNNVNFGAQRYASTWAHWTNPWNVENREGEWPRLGGSNNRVETTFWLDNMAFVRLKNLQIGYKVPQHLLKKIGVDNARLFGSAENLATFTKYRGLDPEMNGNRSDAYPMTKSYSLGINIGI